MELFGLVFSALLPLKNNSQHGLMFTLIYDIIYERLTAFVSSVHCTETVDESFKLTVGSFDDRSLPVRSSSLSITSRGAPGT